MLKVDCQRCGKELNVPGALIFGVPDTDASVNKHHICVFCWDQLLAWLYNDGDVVVHPAVSGRLRVPRSDPNAPTCECGSRGTLHVSGCTSADATRPQ